AEGGAGSVPGEKKAAETVSEQAGVLPPAEPAPRAESYPPQLAATAASKLPSEAPATAGVAEPVAEPPSAEVSAMAEESGQATEAFSVLRWFMAAGAQTSGNVGGKRQAASTAVPADTPAAADTVEAGGADDAQETAGAVPSDESAGPTPPPSHTASLEPEPTRFGAGQAAYDAGDYKAALATWLSMALDGDPEVQYSLGRMYLAGTGVAPDQLQAYMWWTLAANQSHVKAARSLRLLVADMSEAEIVAGEILVEDWADRR
ncbi:MAG: hypothetical protein ACE5JZ_10470, partial [Kiloniellales bacterium]